MTLLSQLSRRTSTSTARYYVPLSVRLLSSSSIVRSAEPVSKVYASADEAVADIQAGSTVLSSGFGLAGTPDTLIEAISRNAKIQNLTCVSNNAGVGDRGLGKLLGTGQITGMISSFLGSNKTFEQAYLSGKVALQLTPQGSIVERCRAGAFGIPAFYTPTGYGTAVQTGELVTRYERRQEGDTAPPKPKEFSKPRESREFNGKGYILEEAIFGDVAIVHAWKADKMGNCMFRYSSSNFGPAFAKNAKLTIVEAEEIVETGMLDANTIHLPSIFVDRVVQATKPMEIENVILAKDSSSATSSKEEADPKKAEARRKRELIVKRAAKELRNGTFCNLGVGMPSLVPSFLPDGVEVVLHSENGILGTGPPPTKETVDANLIDAGKATVTLKSGASTFDSSESFGIIRGGHLDVSILGALQVDALGNLANYTIPGKVVKGMGGAMDLVSSPEHTKILILMEHCDKSGASKIVEHATLPLTGTRCVSRIITELAVFDVDRAGQGGLTLVEVMPGATLDEIEAKTDAKFSIADSVAQ